MSWEFNKDVADNFDYIADTSIPKYRIILYKTIDLIKQYCSQDATILEVGCANGNTMQLLHDAGFKNIIGIDNSRAMVKKCTELGYAAEYADTFPEFDKTYDAIIANWTLHFIVDKQARIQYLKDIYANLSESGIFILSEKVIGDDTEYLNFKRANFLSEDDIAYKRESLKGVLEPWSDKYYKQILRDIGFNSIEIINKTYCFSTFLIKK